MSLFLETTKWTFTYGMQQIWLILLILLTIELLLPLPSHSTQTSTSTLVLLFLLSFSHRYCSRGVVVSWCSSRILWHFWIMNPDPQLLDSADHGSWKSEKDSDPRIKEGPKPCFFTDIAHPCSFYKICGFGAIFLSEDLNKNFFKGNKNF